MSWKLYQMDGFLMSLGFNKSAADPNLYYHIAGNKCLILVLYVDDLFLTGSERLVIARFVGKVQRA